MNRREVLRNGALAAGAAAVFPFGWVKGAEPTNRKRVFMFTRSQAFEHSVVKRGKNNELSLAEKIVTALGEKNGFDVTCSKDGRDFLPENIAKYDAFLFETTGDLTQDKGSDNNPGMPPEGKKAFLDELLITSTGWGADPYGHMRFSAENSKWFRFDGQYRRFKYFNFLDNFANPNTANATGTVVVLPAATGRHGYDVRQEMGDTKGAKEAYEQAFKLMLRNLFDAGYLDRPKQQKYSPNSNYKHLVYTRTEKAARAVDASASSKQALAHRSNSYPHELMVDLGFYAPLWYAAAHDPTLRLYTAHNLISGITFEIRTAQGIQRIAIPNPTRDNPDPFLIQLKNGETMRFGGRSPTPTRVIPNRDQRC